MSDAGAKPRRMRTETPPSELAAWRSLVTLTRGLGGVVGMEFCVEWAQGEREERRWRWCLGTPSAIKENREIGLWRVESWDTFSQRWKMLHYVCKMLGMCRDEGETEEAGVIGVNYRSPVLSKKECRLQDPWGAGFHSEQGQCISADKVGGRAVGPEAGRGRDFAAGIHGCSFLLACLISVREAGSSAENTERVVLRLERREGVKKNLGKWGSDITRQLVGSQVALSAWGLQSWFSVRPLGIGHSQSLSDLIRVCQMK